MRACRGVLSPNCKTRQDPSRIRRLGGRWIPSFCFLFALPCWLSRCDRQAREKFALPIPPNPPLLPLPLSAPQPGMMREGTAERGQGESEGEKGEVEVEVDSPS